MTFIDIINIYNVLGGHFMRHETQNIGVTLKITARSCGFNDPNNITSLINFDSDQTTWQSNKRGKFKSS